MFANLTESIAKPTSLGLFQELGYAVILGPQLVPGEPVAERDLLCDVVLAGRLSEAIRQINPASSKASQTTVAQPATVQFNCWKNL
jgi:hypothetical protein